MDEQIYLKFNKAIQVFSHSDKEKILKALKLAKKYHKGQIYEPNRPFILHPLEVALNVLEYGEKNWQLVVAALLHDTLEDTNLLPQEIEKNFSSNVLFIVEGVTRKKPLKESEGMHYVNKKKKWEKLMVSDKEIRFVKCCDWLANSRNWLLIPKGNKLQKKIPRFKKELKNLYIPLAKKTNNSICKEMQKVLSKI